MRSRLHAVLGAAAAMALAAGCTTAHSPGKASSKEPGLADPRPPAEYAPAKLAAPVSEQQLDAFAHFAAGVSYELRDEAVKALEEFYQAALGDPGNELIVSDVVRRLMQAKDWERAQQLLNKATALAEAPAGLFALKGAVLAQAGKIEEAIKADQTAIKLEPDDISGYRNLFQLYAQRDQPKEALEVLDEAAARPEIDPLFLVDVADMYAALGRLRPTELERIKPKLTAVLDRTAALKPDQQVIIQHLADDYRLVGNYAKATTLYLDLLDRFPDTPEIRQKLTDAYLQSGDKGKAVEQLKTMNRENPTRYPQAYYILGLIYREEDKLAEAAEQFQNGIIVKGDFEPFYYELAAVQISLGKPEAALKTLYKAGELFPRKFLQEFYRAMAYLRMENFSKAVEHMNTAEILARANEPERLTPLFYHQLGSAYERNKNYEQAEKYFEKSLELEPDFAESLNYLGYMWAERGTKLDRARELIEKALKQEPKNSAYLDSMGWVLYKLSRPKEALEFQLKAIELSEKPDATLLDHLGDIYAAMKEYSRARDAWEKSLKLEANQEIKKKLETAPAADAPKR